MNLASSLSDKLLASAFEQQAADIHFSPFIHKTDIHFRIHGQRQFQTSVPSSDYQMLLTYYKFISGMDIGEIRKPQNGTIHTEAKASRYALRLSTMPAQHAESLAIRILPQDQSLSLEQLFLFPEQTIRLKKWMSCRAGLILLTGPTGSGKTTALYALLKTACSEKNMQAITLEDPIEKEIPGLLQVQINPKAGITFESGLRASLRHDPDVLMIGEIRDEATAKLAFQASLTGHLVLSTLHAKNAAGTIARLLDMGIRKADIQQSLIGAAAVQLVPYYSGMQIAGRAAFTEMIEGEAIDTILSGKQALQVLAGSFDHSRKKAFAYGFIDEEIYFQG